MIRSSQLHIMIITWSLRRVTNVRLAESVGDFVLQTQIACLKTVQRFMKL